MRTIILGVDEKEITVRVFYAPRKKKDDRKSIIRYFPPSQVEEIKAFIEKWLGKKKQGHLMTSSSVDFSEEYGVSEKDMTSLLNGLAGMNSTKKKKKRKGKK